MSMRDSIEDRFATLACRVSNAAGSFWAFALALFVVIAWGLTGPIFSFSETWQLVINTSTTIVTFLMVFVIQHAQNKDMRAVQLKLNELIAALEGASNRLIDVEDLTDREIEALLGRYRHLVKSAKILAPGAHTSVDNEPDEKISPALDPARAVGGDTAYLRRPGRRLKRR
jgi:low affinity Fe/Cu permease